MVASLATPYRKGSRGQKYKITAVHPRLSSGYHSGRQSNHKAKPMVASLATPYRKGSRGQKYKITAVHPGLTSGYHSGKGGKRFQVDIQRKFASSTSYRKGGAVHKYKVKTIRKEKPAPRKRNATAMRSKKLAYLEKTAKGKRPLRREKKQGNKKISFNDFLKRVILVLSILVAISLAILAVSQDYWRHPEEDLEIFSNEKGE